MTGTSPFAARPGRPLVVLLAATLLSGAVAACGQSSQEASMAGTGASSPATTAAESGPAADAAVSARGSASGSLSTSGSTAAAGTTSKSAVATSGATASGGRTAAGSGAASGSGESARPAPGRGAVVPSVDVPSRPPVDVVARGDLGNGLVATVSSVRFTTQKGRGVGEVSGPAAVLGVTVRNGGSTPVDLGGATVTLAYGDDVQAASYDSAPAAPLTGRVAPGASATGTYVFALPEDQRGRTVLTITAGAGQPVAVYTGDLAKAAS